MFQKTFVLFASFFTVSQGLALEIKAPAQESRPKYILEEVSGKKVMTGIAMDIMKAIESKDKEIKFVGNDAFTPFKRIEVGLENGEYDAFFGMIKNPEREKKYKFVSVPLYPTKNMMAVRSDDNVNVQNFDDIKKLGKEGLILVAAGTAHYKFLKEQGGLQIDEEGKTVELNLKKLLAKRGRFVYSSDKNFSEEIRKPDFHKKVKILPAVFNEEYQYLAFSKKVPESTIARLEKVLKELEKDGVLSKIYEKYIDIK